MSVHSNPDKITKDGRKWYFTCYYKDLEGNSKKYISKMFYSRKEAENEELAFKTRNDCPVYVKFDVIANDYFNELENKRKNSTVYAYKKDYKNHIEPYFKDKYINDINIPTLRKWQEAMLKKGLAVSYLNKIYVVLDNIINFSMRNYGIKTNYLSILGRFEKTKDKVIEDKDKIRYITYDEFNKFISVADDEMYRLFFIFLYYTGVRKGEAFALSWNDIDFNNNTINISKTLNNDVKGDKRITSNKTNTNRRIKMSSYLKQELYDYYIKKKKYRNFKESWFVFGDVKYISKTSAARYKSKYFKLSGVREITLHEFRHSHVSLLINEYIKTSKKNNTKVDMNKFFFMLSSRMGHSVEVMLNTYAHLSPDVMQDEIVDLLDNL